MKTNKKLSNKEMRVAKDLSRAMFNGNENLIKNLLGVKPIIIGNEEDVLKALNNDESDLSKYIRGLSKSIVGNKENKTGNKQKQDIKQQRDPQVGDEVLILDSPEGIKDIKGVIIDEVKGAEQFLVKLSELNVLYVDKDKVQVIKKKQDLEEINKLKMKIEKLKDYKNGLIGDVQFTTEQISQLEQDKRNMQQELKQITSKLEQYKQQLEKLVGVANA